MGHHFNMKSLTIWLCLAVFGYAAGQWIQAQENAVTRPPNGTQCNRECEASGGICSWYQPTQYHTVKKAYGCKLWADWCSHCFCGHCWFKRGIEAVTKGK